MPFSYLLRPRSLFALIFIGAAFVFLTPGPFVAKAHGAGTEIFRQSNGPYVIAVRLLPLQPLVGQLHLTVTVDLVETGEPVEDAQVRVTGRHRDGSAEAQFSPGLNIPTERRYYDANFDIEDGGTWDFEVEVFGAEGEGAVTVPVLVGGRVRGDSLGIEGTAIFALVTAALFGGGAWIVFTARRKQRLRREHRAAARRAP